MKANKFLIGCSYERIKSINEQPLGVIIWDESIWYNIGECTDFLEHYKPIPITEEWLLKFGFDKDGTIKGTGFLFRIYFDKKTPYAYLETYGGGEYNIEIKYVHSLQNLYFALTGEELTIKL